MINLYSLMQKSTLLQSSMNLNYFQKAPFITSVRWAIKTIFYPFALKSFSIRYPFSTTYLLRSSSCKILSKLKSADAKCQLSEKSLIKSRQKCCQRTRPSMAYKREQNEKQPKLILSTGRTEVELLSLRSVWK